MFQVGFSVLIKRLFNRFGHRAECSAEQKFFIIRNMARRKPILQRCFAIDTKIDEPKLRIELMAYALRVCCSNSDLTGSEDWNL